MSQVQPLATLAPGYGNNFELMPQKEFKQLPINENCPDLNRIETIPVKICPSECDIDVCEVKKECDPCAKPACDPCAKSQYSNGWGWFGMLVLWFIIFTVLFWLIYYSLKPSFVIETGGTNVDTAKVLLAAVVSALILVLIIGLIKAAVVRR